MLAFRPYGPLRSSRRVFNFPCSCKINVMRSMNGVCGRRFNGAGTFSPLNLLVHSEPAWPRISSAFSLLWIVVRMVITGNLASVCGDGISSYTGSGEAD